MNRTHQWLLLLSTSGVLFLSCNKSEQTNGKAVMPVNVRIETVKPRTLVDAIQVAGTVKASEDANISPEEGGVVKEWAVKRGQAVNKGDVIIVLKDELVKAGLEAAEAAYNIAQQNLVMQARVYEEKGISELAYKNFVFQRDAAKAQYDIARVRWDRTRIKSPIGGIVDNIIPNIGEFAPPGMPVARVVNVSVVKVQAEVPEVYSGSISLSTRADITFDALRGDTLRGTVSFVGSTVSSSNRTLLVEITVTNPYRKLKPEMIAKVKLFRENKSNAILVSDDIIQLVDRNRIIVYVENNGKASERQLTIGGRQGKMVEVTDGLKIGDRLIVAGYQDLIDGTPVVITE